MNKAAHCWRCEAACTQRCSRCRVAFYCSKECQKQDKWRHKPDCDAAALKTQCSSCGLEREGMMKCSNCLEVSYCSTECQRNDWTQHKLSCQESVEKTLKLVEEMRKLFKWKEGNTGLVATYYWGNVPAVDLLNLSMNEGEEYSDPLALLLCGVGDPRNVLLTIASLPDVYKEKVTFILNDICPCTLARTILLLYMIYKGMLFYYYFLFLFSYFPSLELLGLVFMNEIVPDVLHLSFVPLTIVYFARVTLASQF